MSEQSQAPQKTNVLRLALIPLGIFIVLASVFALQLLSGKDASTIPSALVDRAAPQVVLTQIEGVDVPLFETSKLEGQVSVVNVWASWCAPCRSEHPLLIDLGKDDRFQIAGINYKDKAAQAAGFLDELGNPFDVIGADENGRAGIEWGVYGVPETFIVGRDGTIAYKHVGPLLPSSMTGAFGQALEKALAE